MLELVNNVNDVLWAYCLIPALVACGLWFTWRTRFVQFRMVGEMFRLLRDSSSKPKGMGKHISSFLPNLFFVITVFTNSRHIKQSHIHINIPGLLSAKNNCLQIPFPVGDNL